MLVGARTKSQKKTKEIESKRSAQLNKGEGEELNEKGMPHFFPRNFGLHITFGIDANGILNVSEVEKSTNRKNKIIITNDKRRLSREDIDRMVNEAERYHTEDEKQRERVVAKNNFESYCFNMKSTRRKRSRRRYWRLIESILSRSVTRLSSG